MKHFFSILLSFFLVISHTNYIFAEEFTASESLSLKTDPSDSFYENDGNMGLDTNTKNKLDKAKKEFSFFQPEFYVFTGLILLAGAFQWDWGGNGISFHNEGWFGEDTSYGGADKMGHYYSSYLMTDLMASLYEKRGR